jgi:hypothetical protein
MQASGQHPYLGAAHLDMILVMLAEQLEDQADTLEQKLTDDPPQQ